MLIRDTDALVAEPYGAGQFKFAAPGDEQEPLWFLRFNDPDCREMMFDTEAEAWAAWNQYAPTYNCHLFQRSILPPTTSAGDGELVERAFAVIPKAGDTIEALLARVKELEEALTDIRDHARYRIQDGLEMGATVWRLALEDIVGDADAALNPSPTEQGEQG